MQRLLLTHFHRDRCTGFGEWQAAGAEVVIPFAERRCSGLSDSGLGYSK
ncbi:MAG TPA: hypothetical protein PL105_03880 [Caldilineaceae bacterium]|nr:hypothetical protein [Caldilineaceae bacterium]